jgi:hypothetical protein
MRGEPIDPANFYDLFRDAQRASETSPLRDLYSTKDTYVSLALTNGVTLTCYPNRAPSHWRRS